MKFAKYVFLAVGNDGASKVFPLYFLESKLAADYPPAMNHSEQFYSFIGVTLVLQVFLLFIDLSLGSRFLISYFRTRNLPPAEAVS